MKWLAKLAGPAVVRAAAPIAAKVTLGIAAGIIAALGVGPHLDPAAAAECLKLSSSTNLLPALVTSSAVMATL